MRLARGEPVSDGKIGEAFSIGLTMLHTGLL